MSVSAVESSPGMFGLTPATNTGSSSAVAANSADKEMFLQLLVAQMKYQDPSNPQDSGEFLAQSAQFTALEKMQAVADQTEQLVALQMSFGASSMIGRTVTFPTPDGRTHTGVVDSVEFGANGPMLSVDGQDVAMASVQSVAATSSTPA